MGMKVGGGGGGPGEDLNAEINVTPFVDVMLVLLVIFMITAPMLTTGVDLSLPEVTAQNVEDPKGKLILSIDKNKQLFLGSTPVKWADLEIKLSKNERVQVEQEIYVEADQNLPYGVVVTAMAVAKDAGVRKVMMMTDPTEQLKVDDLDRAAASAGAASPGGSGNSAGGADKPR